MDELKAREVLGIFVSISFLMFMLFYDVNFPQKQPQDTPPAAAATAQVAPARAILQFQETIFDFGTIQAGTIVKHAYVFTNTGTQPLVIHEVTPSCKLCTKVSFTKQVVQPGEQGSILAEFNSAGRSGQQGKYVTIWSNDADSPTRVLIRGEVR